MGSGARFMAALGFLFIAFLCGSLFSLDSAFASAPKLFLATSFGGAGAALWITFVGGIANSKDLMAGTKAKFKDLMTRIKAEIPDMDTFLSAEILTLLVAPLVLVLLSTYATVFNKQGLLEYQRTFRFSLEFGRLFGCICIAVFIFSRFFRHFILMRIILLLLGVVSTSVFHVVFHGYLTLLIKHYYN